MSNIRFQALQAVLTRVIPEVKIPAPKISEFFGTNVFDKKKMKEFLSTEAYQGIVNSIEKGEPIPRDLAEQVRAIDPQQLALLVEPGSVGGIAEDGVPDDLMW